MTRDAKEAVHQVLRRAGDTPGFFDLSEAERLVRMVAMGFELGVARGRRGSSAVAEPDGAQVDGPPSNGGGSLDRRKTRGRRG